MPQLDLSTFFFNIWIITFIYLFIYIIVRGSFVMYISSIFKYRKKITDYLIFQKNFFSIKFFRFTLFLENFFNIFLSIYLKFVLQYFWIINNFFYYWINFFSVKFLKLMQYFIFTFLSMTLYIKNSYE
jgi:hypothetical protein